MLYLNELLVIIFLLILIICILYMGIIILRDWFDLYYYLCFFNIKVF